MLTFDGALVITAVTLIWFLPCVNPHVSLEVRVDLELGMTHFAFKRRVPSVCAKMHNQLTGIATGIGAHLTPEEQQFCCCF